MPLQPYLSFLPPLRNSVKQGEKRRSLTHTSTHTTPRGTHRCA